jgi:hypothetical protein
VGLRLADDLGVAADALGEVAGEGELVAVVDLGAEEVVEAFDDAIEALLLRIPGLAGTDVAHGIEGVLATFLAEANLVLRALLQAVVREGQVGEVEVLLLQVLGAQQRVQVAGKDAELLQLGVVVVDHL